MTSPAEGASGRGREARHRMRRKGKVSLEGPYFRNPSSVQQAKVLEAVKFECDVANLSESLLVRVLFFVLWLLLFSLSPSHLDQNVITWKNLTSDRVIYAGSVNVLNDDRLRVSREGRDLVIGNISKFDTGLYRCTVEMANNPISLEHRLNVLGEEAQ